MREWDINLDVAFSVTADTEGDAVNKIVKALEAIGRNPAEGVTMVLATDVLYVGNDHDGDNLDPFEARAILENLTTGGARNFIESREVA